MTKTSARLCLSHLLPCLPDRGQSAVCPLIHTAPEENAEGGLSLALHLGRSSPQGSLLIIHIGILYEFLEAESCKVQGSRKEDLLAVPDGTGAAVQY